MKLVRVLFFVGLLASSPSLLLAEDDKDAQINKKCGTCPREVVVRERLKTLQLPENAIARVRGCVNAVLGTKTAFAIPEFPKLKIDADAHANLDACFSKELVLNDELSKTLSTLALDVLKAPNTRADRAWDLCRANMIRCGINPCTGGTPARPSDVRGSWTGVFREYSEHHPAGVTTSTETVTISGNAEEITARIAMRGASRAWSARGYYAGQYLVLSYSSRDPTNPAKIGLGTYFLERASPKGRLFRGFWIGIDCQKQHVVQCPYVLTRDLPVVAKFLSSPCIELQPAHPESCQPPTAPQH